MTRPGFLDWFGLALIASATVGFAYHGFAWLAALLGFTTGAHMSLLIHKLMFLPLLQRRQ